MESHLQDEASFQQDSINHKQLVKAIADLSAKPYHWYSGWTKLESLVQCDLIYWDTSMTHDKIFCFMATLVIVKGRLSGWAQRIYMDRMILCSCKMVTCKCWLTVSGSQTLHHCFNTVTAFTLTKKSAVKTAQLRIVKGPVLGDTFAC